MLETCSSGVSRFALNLVSVPYFHTQHPLAGDQCDYCLPALVNRSFLPAEFARVGLAEPDSSLSLRFPRLLTAYTESRPSLVFSSVYGDSWGRAKIFQETFSLLLRRSNGYWCESFSRPGRGCSLRYRSGGQGPWTDALVVDSISSLPPLAVWIRTIDRMPCVVYDLRYGRCGLLFHSHIGLDAVCDCFGSSAVVRRWLRFLGSKDLGDLVAVGRL